MSSIVSQKYLQLKPAKHWMKDSKLSIIQDIHTCPGTLGHSLADKNLSSIVLTSGSRFTASQYPPLKPHLNTTDNQKHSQSALEAFTVCTGSIHSLHWSSKITISWKTIKDQQLLLGLFCILSTSPVVFPKTGKKVTTLPCSSHLHFTSYKQRLY